MFLLLRKFVSTIKWKRFARNQKCKLPHTQRIIIPLTFVSVFAKKKEKKLAHKHTPTTLYESQQLKKRLTGPIKKCFPL